MWGDLKDSRWIIAKGLLFLAAGCIAHQLVLVGDVVVAVRGPNSRTDKVWSQGGRCKLGHRLSHRDRGRGQCAAGTLDELAACSLNPGNRMVLAGGLATSASWLCYFHALKVGDASKVAPVDKLSVVVAMILAMIFLGEAVTARHWMGGLLIVLGAIVIAWK